MGQHREIERQLDILERRYKRHRLVQGVGHDKFEALRRPKELGQRSERNFDSELANCILRAFFRHLVQLCFYMHVDAHDFEHFGMHHIGFNSPRMALEHFRERHFLCGGGVIGRLLRSLYLGASHGDKKRRKSSSEADYFAQLAGNRGKRDHGKHYDCVCWLRDAPVQNHLLYKVWNIFDGLHGRQLVLFHILSSRLCCHLASSLVARQKKGAS